jgi:hypothetical protein
MLSTRLRAGVTICVLGLGLWACGDDSGSGASGAGGATGGGDEGGQATTGGGGQGGSSTQGGGGQAEGGSGGVSACEAAIADAYDGAAFTTNAAASLTLRSQFNAAQQPMKDAEADLLVVPTAAELDALYQVIAPQVTSYYDPIVDAVLVDFAAAAGNEWTPSEPPVAPGGKFGKYIFREDGADLRQHFEKGLFGALFLNQAFALGGQVDTLEELDALLALYGAHPDFPGDSETTDTALVPNPDRIYAQYAERRSPKNPNDASKPANEGMPGPYFRIKRAFIDAQEAIKAGSQCDATRDAAVASILTEIDRVNAATVIYYLHDAVVKLTADNPTTDQLAGGLHGYNEALAFLHGLKGLPDGARVITDAQIDDLLSDLLAPAGGSFTSYQLLLDPAATAPALLGAIAELGSIYGFSAAELEGFETNH